MKLWKNSGHYLFWTGVIHNVIGFTLGWKPISIIIERGVWNSARHDVEGTGEILWFLLFGFMMMISGVQMQNRINEKGTPPLPLIGWSMLFLGIVTSIVLPVSGAWLFIIQGIIILVAQKKKFQAI